MKDLLNQNEVRKQRLAEEDEQERQENIQQMKAYAQMVEEQERAREDALRERDQKIKDYQSMAFESMKKDYEEKLAVMEKRSKRYEDRKERKLDELEQQKKLNA